MVTKAMNANFDSESRANKDAWNNNNDWAKRENYFLYLRDNQLRYKWKSGSDFYIDIANIINKARLSAELQKIGIVLEEFDHQSFATANAEYIQPVLTAQQIIDAVKNQQEIPINTTDLWTQAILYYYIWIEYNFEVPHNNYSDWFTNTKDIVTMLDKHGVTI
jgi:hypothetical protein